MGKTDVSQEAVSSKGKPNRNAQAAAGLLGSADRPGSSYYHTEVDRPLIPDWLAPLVARCRDSKQEVRAEHVQDIPEFQVIEAQLRPMLDVSEKFEGTVIVLRDITTLRTVEASLAEDQRVTIGK